MDRYNVFVGKKIQIVNVAGNGIHAEVLRMMEHEPIYPNWQCVRCHSLNNNDTKVCSNCFKIKEESRYISPCDNCDVKCKDGLFDA